MINRHSPSISITNDTRRKIPATAVAAPATSPDTTNRDEGSTQDMRKARPLHTLLDSTPESTDNNNNGERRPLIRAIRPKASSKCPLLGCFYSEFDIKKGTVIVCQSPPSVMDQDIHLPMSEMQMLLQKAFEDLERRGEAVGVVRSSTKTSGGANVGDDDDKHHDDVVDDNEPDDEANGEFNNEENNEDAEDYEDDDSVDGGNHETDTAKKGHYGSERDDSDQGSEVPREEEGIPQSPTVSTRNNPPPLSSPPVNGGGSGGGLSIFDSTSEFIITGTELMSKIITLSAHSWHVMTRPTMISNSRYERNSHLFSVGFLLRRAADPRPFRPLLSKLAMTLQALEEESCFLTRLLYRPKLQTLLEGVLLSLNSPEYECNLLLSASNALHLKLFHTPKPEASPVHDYQVPILLRRELQLQMYDWDLAINWVILHIDGISNARHISVKAEVDLEMVLACLRVLKHHGIIALVSPFNYSNRYEFTPKATAAMAGKESRLVQEGLAYCLKRVRTGDSQLSPSNGPVPTSPSNNLPFGNDPPESDHPTQYHTSFSLFGLTPSSSYPPRSNMLSASQQQPQQRAGRFGSIPLASSLERESSSVVGVDTKTRQELRWLKSALTELYCVCSRSLSFGDLWLTLTSTDDEDGDEEEDDEVLVSHHHSTSWVQAAPPIPPRWAVSSKSTSRGSAGEDHSEGPGLDGRLVSVSSSVVIDTISHHLASLKAYNRSSHRYRSRSLSTVAAESTTTTTATLEGGGDWKDFFTRIDHRRFCTFGMLHGWIVRIHCYPCFPYPFPPAPSTTTNSGSYLHYTPVTATTTTPSTGNGLVDNSKYKAVEDHTTTMGGSGSSSSNEYALARMAASMMDGTRCDDELACALETPIAKLIKLVEKHGHPHSVICLYAE